LTGPEESSCRQQATVEEKPASFVSIPNAGGAKKIPITAGCQCQWCCQNRTGAQLCTTVKERRLQPAVAPFLPRCRVNAAFLSETFVRVSGGVKLHPSVSLPSNFLFFTRFPVILLRSDLEKNGRNTYSQFQHHRPY
jgi:hypothetical protein